MSKKSREVKIDSPALGKIDQTLEINIDKLFSVVSESVVFLRGKSPVGVSIKEFLGMMNCDRNTFTGLL